MECYDISTFQGALAVGSGVSFKEGEPDKGSGDQAVASGHVMSFQKSGASRQL